MAATTGLATAMEAAMATRQQSGPGAVTNLQPERARRPNFVPHGDTLIF